MPKNDRGELLRVALVEQKTGLVAYLVTKIKAEDWHAVQDAASDIREVESRLELLRLLGG